MAYSPELVRAAQAATTGLMNQQPAAIPKLSAATAARLPEYQKLLGADRGMSEAQMLLELGQRAFGFASNVDEGGRPLRGSFGARLAGAVKTLPTAIGKNVEAMDKIDRQIKVLAVQQGEKDIDQVVSQNTELLRRKTDLFKEVLKADARMQAERLKGLGSSIFGKGDWEWNLVNMPGMIDRYAKGETNPTETNLVSSAITKLKMPRIETRQDPVTRQPYTVEIPGTLPDFVTQAEKARRALNLPTAATPVMGAGAGASRVAPSPGAQASPQPAGGPAPTVQPVPGPTAPGSAPPAAPTAAAPEFNLWTNRFKIAGPASGAIAAVSSIPGLGDPAAHITLARKDAVLTAERLKEALLKSAAGSTWEQKQLEKVLDIIPSATTDPDVYGTRLIALGQTLQEGIQEFTRQGADNSGLSPEAKGRARQKAMEYQKFYKQLGLPPAVYSEAEFRKYPPGTEVLWQGRIPAKVQPQ